MCPVPERAHEDKTRNAKTRQQVREPGPAFSKDNHASAATKTDNKKIDGEQRHFVGPYRPKSAQNLSSELTFPPEQQLKKEPDKRRKG